MTQLSHITRTALEAKNAYESGKLEVAMNLYEQAYNFWRAWQVALELWLNKVAYDFFVKADEVWNANKLAKKHGFPEIRDYYSQRVEGITFWSRRFSVRQPTTYTIPVDKPWFEEYTPEEREKVPFEYVYHLTTREAWEKIKQSWTLKNSSGVWWFSRFEADEELESKAPKFWQSWSIVWMTSNNFTGWKEYGFMKRLLTHILIHGNRRKNVELVLLKIPRNAIKRAYVMDHKYSSPALYIEKYGKNLFSSDASFEEVEAMQKHERDKKMSVTDARRYQDDFAVPEVWIPHEIPVDLIEVDKTLELDCGVVWNEFILSGYSEYIPYETYNTTERTFDTVEDEWLVKQESWWQTFWSAGAWVLVMCPETREVLILERSNKVFEPGTWGISWGARKKIWDKVENSFSTAIWESKEELGTLPVWKVRYIPIHYKKPNSHFQYDTYVLEISKTEREKYIPTLNWEHVAYKWQTIDQLGKENLHPWLQAIVGDIYLTPQKIPVVEIENIQP
jgi:hypothetical protein